MEILSTPLVKAKTRIPPARLLWLERPRLLTRLIPMPDSALVLVSAPAGFGKTTLLSTWAWAIESHRLNVEGSQRSSTLLHPTFNPPAVAWVSLDEGDNDPARFWAYAILALSQALGSQADLRPAEESTRSIAQSGWEGTLALLLNAMEKCESECLFILDDYHQIYAPAVHASIAYWIEHLPEGHRLAIGSRATPPLPLARLRARGQLLELRGADLRFTPEEARSYFRHSAKLELEESQAASLAESCEGWAAGLQLASLAVQAALNERGSQGAGELIRSFTGRQRSVLNFLMDEVFAAQPAAIQRFLLKTSILERLCAPLCDALFENRDWRVETGEQRSKDDSQFSSLYSQLSTQAVLEYLADQNLFVQPLDEEGRWYRYHRLFAGALRARLEAQQAWSLPDLHRRASEWFAGQGEIHEAIAHAFAIPDTEMAAGLLVRPSDAMLARGELATLADWLEKLPEACLAKHPRLLLCQAWILAMRGEVNALGAILEQVETAARTGDEPAERDILSGRLAAMQSFPSLLQRDPIATAELCESALSRLPEDDLFWRGIALRGMGEACLWRGDLEGAAQAIRRSSEVSLAAGDLSLGLSGLNQVAGLELVQGRLAQAVQIYREAIEMVSTKGWQKHPYVGILHAGLASVLLEWNQVEEAAAHLEEALALERQVDIKAITLSVQYPLTRLRLAQGDAPTALQAIEKMEAQFATPGIPAGPSPFGAMKARLELSRGNLEIAEVWAKSRGLACDDPALQGRETDYLALALILLAKARRNPEGLELSQATGLLERLCQVTQTGSFPSIQIECLLGLALARKEQGRIDEAKRLLEEALELGEPGGYIRIFADFGKPLFELLKVEGLQLNISPEYESHLKLAFLENRLQDQHLQPTSGSQHPRPVPRLGTLLDPLTQRELEVLRLVSGGASNQEIADRLVVSLATVKSHINHIMGKLDAQNRTEAVARGRELGIL